MRQVFYGLINLANVLTVRRGGAPRNRKCARGVSQAAGSFGRNRLETIVNYIAIAPGQYRGGIFITRGPACLLSPCRRSGDAARGLCIAALVLVAILHRRLRAQNRRLSTAHQQHVARTEHVRRAGPHHSAQPALSRNVQAVARHREARLYAAATDPTSQRHRTVLRRRRPPTAKKSSKASARAKARSITCRPATAASCSPRTSRCRTAAGSPPMRTSPSSATPRKNAPPSAIRSSGARSSTRPSPRSARRWRNFCPA